MIRLFVTGALASGAELELSAEQAHYLQNVMRLAPGQALLAFNGRDGEWRAELVAAGKRGRNLTVVEQTRAQAAPGPDVELIIAMVKRARLENAIEKAVELGCRRIRLMVTRRTNTERANVERLGKIAVEAAEQAGRIDVPEVAAPVRLDRMLDDWEPARRLMFCDEAGDDPAAEWGGPQGRARPALDALRSATPPGPWSILIGPEGGFDPAERAHLRGLSFVTPVTLGPRILRADTAAIAALALWQAAFGDWRA